MTDTEMINFLEAMAPDAFIAGPHPGGGCVELLSWGERYDDPEAPKTFREAIRLKIAEMKQEVEESK